MESNEVRAIVPGRIEKNKRATLRAVTGERNHNEGTLALASQAVEIAQRTYRGFRPGPGVTSILVALPEDEPDPLFEAIWQTLTLPAEETVILTVITTDSDGAQLDIQTKNVPIGWRWEWMESGPDYPNDEISSPYDGDDAVPSACSPCS